MGSHQVKVIDNKTNILSFYNVLEAVERTLKEYRDLSFYPDSAIQVYDCQGSKIKGLT